MRLSLKPALFAILVLSAVCVAQPKAAGPEDSPQAAEVRKVTRDFWAAVGQQDNAKASALLDASNPNLATMAATFADSAKVAKKFQAAMVAKFGEEATRGAISDDLNPEAMAARSDRQPIKIDGDKATIGDGMALKRIDGAWKITALINDLRAEKMVAAIFPAMAKIMAETTTEVEAGKYAAVADVRTAMQTKAQPVMQKVMQEMMNAATSGPSSRPARP